MLPTESRDRSSFLNTPSSLVSEHLVAGAEPFAEALTRTCYPSSSPGARAPQVPYSGSRRLDLVPACSHAVEVRLQPEALAALRALQVTLDHRDHRFQRGQPVHLRVPLRRAL